GTLHSLWPLLVQDPEFVPGGLAWDGENNRLVVADRNRPVVAFLNDNGVFLELVSYTIDPSIGGIPNGTVAIDSEMGRLFMRTATGAWSLPLDSSTKTSATFLSLPSSGSDPVFAAANGFLFSSTLDPAIYLVSAWQGPEVSTTIHLPPVGYGIQSFGLQTDGTLVRFQDVNGGVVSTYSIVFPEEMRVNDWIRLQESF
ncbi:MAG: hypothetical protein JJU11_15530, partial [Candidatus Sumerlaeia bacterium]|nr:hypothetical protein [Candidatus Sumerlaeia bacterium]